MEEFRMRSSRSIKAEQIASASNDRVRDTVTPGGLRLLDWTNLDSPPATLDIAQVAASIRGVAARVAVLVNSPRMLRAADVLAEQAGLMGAQVRVFIDSREAKAWLGKARH
jgi:hypothetical protein